MKKIQKEESENLKLEQQSATEKAAEDFEDEDIEQTYTPKEQAEAKNDSSKSLEESPKKR